MADENDAVARAEALAESTEDDATRETLSGLLSAYKKLRRGYLYVLNEGRPEPFPEDAPAGSLEGLEAHWRDEAETLRGAGAESLANLTDRHVSELQATRMWEPLDTVTLKEASEIGGYSYSHLQSLIAAGEIPNAGEKGSPRLYRRDVPRKAGHGSHRPTRSRLELIEGAIGEAANG